MKKWLNVNYLYLLGVLIGGLGGVSLLDPLNSTLYGALKGGLLIGCLVLIKADPLLLKIK